MVEPTTPDSNAGSESTTLSQDNIRLSDDLELRTKDLEDEKQKLKTCEAALASLRDAQQKQETDHADVVGRLRESVSTLEGQLQLIRQDSLRLSNDLLVAPLRRRLQLAPRAHWPPLQCAGVPGQRSQGLGTAAESSQGKLGSAVGRDSTNRGGSVVDARLWLRATTVRLRCAASGPRALLARGEPRGAG